LELENIVLNQGVTLAPQGEKTVGAVVKSVSQNSVLLALANNSSVVLEVPKELVPLSYQGDKVEIPLSVLADSLRQQSLPSSVLAVFQEKIDVAVDKFASQAQQTTDNAAQFREFAQTVLKLLDTPRFSPEEKDFAKAMLKK